MAQKSTECNPYVSKVNPDVTNICYIAKVPWVSTHPRVTYNVAPLVMCASHTIAVGEIIFFPGEVVKTSFSHGFSYGNPIKSPLNHHEIIMFLWLFLCFSMLFGSCAFAMA